MILYYRKGIPAPEYIVCGLRFFDALYTYMDVVHKHYFLYLYTSKGKQLLPFAGILVFVTCYMEICVRISNRHKNAIWIGINSVPTRKSTIRVNKLFVRFLIQNTIEIIAQN